MPRTPTGMRLVDEPEFDDADSIRIIDAIEDEAAAMEMERLRPHLERCIAIAVLSLKNAGGKSADEAGELAAAVVRVAYRAADEADFLADPEERP